MSTKRFAVFARRHEMNEWLDETCSSLGAALIQQDVDQAIRRVASAAALDAVAGLVRAYVTLDAEQIFRVSGKLVPGQMGLVICDLPQEEERTLYLAVIASRSDWRGSDGLRHDNPACHRLFTTVCRTIQPRVTKGVWTRSMVTGAAAIDRGVHVSEGARAWVSNGGTLRQPAVTNIEFLLAEPPRR